ncbi:MAG: AmmeMemoRadiSam system radical SAM enzyme, partial [Candidatus Aminicenantales bacterium]
MIREAMLCEPLEGKKVLCVLCHHRCRIGPSKYGICGVRENREGTLVTHVYGNVIAAHVDPIEKKPLYHFLPGSTSFSIATIGCNFRCPFCQNWQISQASKNDGGRAHGEEYRPEDIVAVAQKHRCQSISYTYTEPTVFFELAYDTAKMASDAGLANVFVTNGYMSEEALETIEPYLDACNVDLKSFREEFYRKMCGAHLQPVLEMIQKMRERDIWVEITTLIIPGENDTDQELTRIARFIVDLDPGIPWHVSRFHPDFKVTDAPPTPVATLRRAYSIGKREGLRFIYVGHVLGESE